MQRASLVNYLKKSVASFQTDPPDSDYQRGYLAALEEVAKHFTVKLPSVKKER